MQPENNNDSIIIRFTKFGYQYRLNKLGNFADKKALALAEEICNRIESDISLGRFDCENNDQLFAQYNPLAYLAKVIDKNNRAEDCIDLVDKKLESQTLRDRNLHNTKNFLIKYGKPIKSSDDALKFWEWLQQNSKGNNKTKNRHLETLKPVCNYFANIPKLKTEQSKSEKPFSKAEIKAICDVFDKDYQHYSAFIKFLFSTGCRTSEAIALTWDSVDFDARTITISDSVGIAKDGSKVRKATKTGISRVLPMSSKLEGLLRYQNKSNELVFPSPEGKFIDIGNFRERVWVKALNQANASYRTLYNTRHTFCSHFLNEVPDFIKLASITHGTKSGVQTLIKHYAHLVDKVSMPDMF